MTSSLVGSEMCIRDRDRAVARDEKKYGGLLFVVAMEARSEKQKGTTHPPVSYTHLTLPTICSV
eukprot:5067416-Prorocentrum_lima.AAC.1